MLAKPTLCRKIKLHSYSAVINSSGIVNYEKDKKLMDSCITVDFDPDSSAKGSNVQKKAEMMMMMLMKTCSFV